MNRAQRRQRARKIAKIKQHCLQRDTSVSATGFRDACPDCAAVADVTVGPDGRIRFDVWHSPACPWFARRQAAS
jgi:hypothetical protein